MPRLNPDHWRYRYARRMRAPLLAVNLAMIVAILVSAATGIVSIAIISIVLMGALASPLGMLGCHQCSFNVFRRYRGPASPEHGDSYTRQFAMPIAIPDTCPKCGATLLTPQR